MFNTIKKWFQLDPLYTWQKDMLSEHELETSCKAILSSPFLGKNILNYRFGSTQGFSVIFKTSEIDTVKKRFPALEPYIENIVSPQEFNLYYLNVLVLHKASKVERHIDHSIRGYYKNLPFPKQVSVLYLRVPNMTGGCFQLFDKTDQLIQEMPPQLNACLRFQGHLKHAITEIKSLEEGKERISVVCEQYKLNESQLEYLPDFTIKTTADFKTFLNHQTPQ